jgi:Protein of unknown function (DUF2924)
MPRPGRRRGVAEGSTLPTPMSPKAESISVMIASLAHLDADRLRLQWRNHLGGLAPAHLPRWLLLRILAFRIQAATFGGLDKATLRLVRASNKDDGESAGARPFETRGPTTREGLGLKSGALLVREWKGRLERVVILDHGFAWNGRTYGSLSRIAREITGTSWNGHRFFGLRPTRDRRGVTKEVGGGEVSGRTRPDIHSSSQVSDDGNHRPTVKTNARGNGQLQRSQNLAPRAPDPHPSEIAS